jgi:hypothetical protein
MFYTDIASRCSMTTVFGSVPDVVSCIDSLSLYALCFLPLSGLLLYLLCSVYSDHSISGQYILRVLFCVISVWYVNTPPNITPQEIPNADRSCPKYRRRQVACLSCKPTIFHQALSRLRARSRGLTHTDTYTAHLQHTDRYIHSTHPTYKPVPTQ